MEFRIVTPADPLPEKSLKECGINVCHLEIIESTVVQPCYWPLIHKF